MHLARWGVDSDMESLAGLVRGTAPTPGVSFARAVRERRPGKDWARDKLLSMFTLKAHPEKLVILTMPGVRWVFEQHLLGLRDGEGVRDGRFRNTTVHAIEREPAIYSASLKYIPGGHLKYKHISNYLPYSVCTMWTPKVHRYYCGRVEDYAVHGKEVLDAAWLDFTGPLNRELLGCLPLLWNRVRGPLIVTALNARWQKNIDSRIQKAGGCAELLRDILPGAVEVARHDYNDGVPMFQTVLRREE
jgi:hypothetical protein